MSVMELPIQIWTGNEPQTDGDALDIVKHYVYQMGWERVAYSYRGPMWKPENKYTPTDLNTTCWYVRIELNGRIYRILGDTYREAVWNSHEMLKGLIGEVRVRRSDDNERYTCTQ